MFKKWLIAATLVAVLAASLVLASCQSGGTAAISTNQQTGISVSAEGKVPATPDIATVSLGVTAQAATIAEAQSLATEAMNQVMNALTANGVANKDIQTSYYNIQEVTEWDPLKQTTETAGFQITNMVTAKIRDLNKAGIIIDAVVAAGGDLTRVNNISFSVEDPTTYYDTARAKAVAAAKAKAESIAELAGVKLGALLYITESTSYYPGTVYYSRATADSASTPISAGEVDITLNVQAVYAIK